MKQLLIVCALVALSGCASIMEKIPSRWDANQARVITDIQVQVKHADLIKKQLDFILAE